MVVEVCLGLSTEDAFKTFVSDKAEMSLLKFFEQRGEQKLSMSLWEDPSETDKVYNDLKVVKTRVMKMEVQIKNNPFVKIAPTTKSFKIIEHTPERIHMRAVNRNNDIPYCDCFGIEEDWNLMSPPGAKCCVLRISYAIIWFKSTMMKSIIRSNTDSESKIVWNAYGEWVVKDYAFKEKKRP